ncbi:hypothetical protein RHSIM_Rhsim02G0256700 [Rhododendron simsii]|uniref:Uncharacterized protein n=1 Tax=Rhododendron simsii TaxID=118357 RepID=A0A834LX50_RHOSS|nr:hypothetical protein RHSIM_Rhsim02G0256700 [Rhododendron simsii]
MDNLSIKNHPNPVRLFLHLLSNQSPATPEALHSTEMLYYSGVNPVIFYFFRSGSSSFCLSDEFMWLVVLPLCVCLSGISRLDLGDSASTKSDMVDLLLSGGLLKAIQKFHLEIVERANHNAETSTIASIKSAPQELYPPQDDFRTACLPLTIEEDFPLIKSGYSACRGHLSAVYMFELNGEIHEDNLALLDGVDYAIIRGIHSGRSTGMI